METIYIILPPLSWLLFALGGYKQKFWRRFVLPVIFTLFALFFASWWQAIGMGVSCSIVYHLGYGESTPWWGKFLVGCSYALATVWLGFTWWQLVIPIVFLSLFALSNWKATEKLFSWKICEGSFGLIIGITISYLLLR